jgi:hypothetical protein
MKYFLIILAFLPLFGNAQTQDTIKLPVNVAKQIVKDLVSGDSAKAELKLCNEHVTLLESKITLKDSIISGHVQKGIMYEDRIKNEQLKFDAQGLWVKDLQKQNKKLKVKLKFLQVTGTAIIGGLTYLYFTK